MDDFHTTPAALPEPTIQPEPTAQSVPPTTSNTYIPPLSDTPYARSGYTATNTPVSYRYTAGLLAIFLGSFGVHNFYLGKRNLAISQLLLSTAGSILTFGLSTTVVWIWSLIEGIMILTGSITVDGRGQAILDSKPPQPQQKSSTIAGFLAIFLGIFGVHNFYLGNTTKAIIQLLLGTFGLCIIVGPIISTIWGILEGVQIFNNEISVDSNNIPLYHPTKGTGVQKSKTAAICLAAGLGYFGVHNFYLGDSTKGLIKLLLSTIGICIIVGPLIAFVWSMLDMIKLAEEEITADILGTTLLKD